MCVDLSDSRSAVSTQAHHVPSASRSCLPTSLKRMQGFGSDSAVSQRRAIRGRCGSQQAPLDSRLCDDDAIWHVAHAALNMGLHPGPCSLLVAIRRELACFRRKLPQETIPAYERFPLERVGPALAHRKCEDSDPERCPECGDGQVAESVHQRPPRSRDSSRHWLERESIHGNERRCEWPTQERRLDECAELGLPVDEMHDSRSPASVGRAPQLLRMQAGSARFRSC